MKKPYVAKKQCHFRLDPKAIEEVQAIVRENAGLTATGVVEYGIRKVLEAYRASRRWPPKTVAL